MEEEVIAGGDVARQQQALDSFEEGASETKTCAEMGDSMESDEDEKGASLPRSILKCRRGNEVPDLNLSLLPSRETLDLFGAPQQKDQTPFAGFSSLTWGSVPPFINDNAFRSSSQELTIFYGGTVHVYNVSTDMGKVIMMVANNKNSSQMSLTPSTNHVDRNEHALTSKIVKFPISQQKSLKYFLEKRKDRHRRRAPYSVCHHT